MLNYKWLAVCCVLCDVCFWELGIEKNPRRKSELAPSSAKAKKAKENAEKQLNHAPAERSRDSRHARFRFRVPSLHPLRLWR